jgi:DNA repair photolyase
MGLNKAAGNMYSWIDFTWNPVKGECPYACSYCYVSRMMKKYGKKQRPMYLDEKELRTDLGTGNFIFVCSGCDLFSGGVSNQDIKTVIEICASWPGKNTYLFHTKNPLNTLLLPVKSNFVLCATIESNRQYIAISRAPSIESRFVGLYGYNGRKMITIEPVMDFDTTEFAELIKLSGAGQVNIGADSGGNHLPEPPPEKIGELVKALEKSGIKVFLKKNLKRLYKEA